LIDKENERAPTIDQDNGVLWQIEMREENQNILNIAIHPKILSFDWLVIHMLHIEDSKEND
jgi:hypothetical protein